MSTNTYDIYTPRDDAMLMNDASGMYGTAHYSECVTPTRLSTYIGPTVPSQILQQPANMDVETGIYIESGPQM
eukprot:3926057-Amphidinium_carterae.1